MFTATQTFEKDYVEEINEFELLVESLEDEIKFNNVLRKLNVDYKSEHVEIEANNGKSVFIFDLNEFINAVIILCGAGL